MRNSRLVIYSNWNSNGNHDAVWESRGTGSNAFKSFRKHSNSIDAPLVIFAFLNFISRQVMRISLVLVLLLFFYEAYKLVLMNLLDVEIRITYPKVGTCEPTVSAGTRYTAVAVLLNGGCCFHSISMKNFVGAMLFLFTTGHRLLCLVRQISALEDRHTWIAITVERLCPYRIQCIMLSTWCLAC